MANYGFSFANDVPAKNLYPEIGSSFGSLGEIATGDAGTTQGGAVVMHTPQVDQALQIASQGHPAPWWIALAVLLVVLMYTAKRFDGEGSYANLKLSAYNIFTITIAAIIGISLFKAFFVKFPVPGLTTVITAV